MAINTVNARYEGFIFDGENSRTYGVYVTDVKVFGTPVRNVEMVTIPGRNGAFSLDNGNFENIEIKYTCAMSADTPADFNDAISDLRNMLASRIGYKRLEDEINTSEYRMAVYKGGLEVPTMNKKTGTFDVVFDCKPQRFLKSGETAVSVASGGTITNPTLFDASPFMECSGGGEIAIGGQTITLTNAPLGRVLLCNGQTTTTGAIRAVFSTESLENGDAITALGNGYYPFTISGAGVTRTVDAITNLTITGAAGTYGNASINYLDEAEFEIYYSNLAFAKGTPKTITTTVSFSMTYTDEGVTSTNNYTVTINFVFDGSTEIVFDDCTISPSLPATFSEITWAQQTPPIYGDSTKLPLAGTVYIDADIGEAYTIENGEYISANNVVSFPAELPTLKPGANTITYDNTITQFKVVPRWWKV